MFGNTVFDDLAGKDCCGSKPRHPKSRSTSASGTDQANARLHQRFHPRSATHLNTDGVGELGFVGHHRQQRTLCNGEADGGARQTRLLSTMP